MSILLGMAQRGRTELRSSLRELGVTKLGHFEKIAQRLAVK